MKKLKMILALAVVLLTSLTLFACGSCGTPDQPTPDKAPVLSVSSDHVAGKVRTAVTLPTAEAVDEVDGDLSGQIRIKILFKDDEKYVLPTAKVSEGVLLADYPTFTPAKVGDYEITYFVVNAKGKEAVQAVSMSVAANPDDELGQNLVGTDCLDSWLAAQSGQNSTVNEYGEIVVAGASNMNYTGAVYMGQKIRNGDTVTFAFRAQPPSEVMFYNVSFLLTPNSDADQPAADEGTWPKYYNMRIGTSITTYVVTLSNNNFDLFPQINVNLCDGNVHTISLKITADAEKVEGRLWIDSEISATPTQTSTVRRSAVAAQYGEDSIALAAFDENLAGWLSFGAYVLGDTANDQFVLKSLAINGSSAVLPPELTVGEFSTMTLNEEYALPAASARDANDYSDISDRISLYVKAPGGEFELFTADIITPDTAGEYVFRYVVTDRSGNVEYRTLTAACSKGTSTTPPEIVFDEDVQERYEVAINSEFMLPVPLSVTDSFGDDLSSRLSVSLTGREKAELTGQTGYLFRAAGENILEYVVEDYNGLVTRRQIVIDVQSDSAGNLLENAADWYLGSGVTLTDEILTVNGGGTSFVYGKQKIYDEKVSMLLNLDIASSAGNPDGVNIVMINIRGGKNLTKVPRTANSPDGTTDFNWNNGLTILFSTHYGLILKPTGYDGSDYAVASLPAGLYETFHGKDVILSFQATDVYEEGVFKGVRFQMWLDGEKVNFSGSYGDENGDVFLTPRVVNLNVNALQAGWLSVYFNDADSVDGEKTVLKAITIDGSTPAVTTVTADKELDESFVIGEEYVLPVVTVIKGEEDVSNLVRKFIWIEGEAQPDLTGEGYAELSVTPDMSYMKGFTVLYVFEGKLVKSIRVANASADAEITFDAETYTAALGQEFTLPVYRAAFGSIDVTDDVVVKLKAAWFESALTGTTYRPTVAETFELRYYLYDKLIASVQVSVTGGVSQDTELTANGGYTTPNDAWKYAKQQIYNNRVELTFKLKNPLEPGHWVDFGLRGNEQNAGGWCSYENGLVLRLNYDATWGTFFKVGYGGSDGWFDASYGESTLALGDVDWTQEHTVVYTVQDVYVDGAFAGIRIDFEFDGQKVGFKDLNGAGYVSSSDGTYILIPADYLAAFSGGQDVFCASYLFVWANGNTVTVTEAYLAGADEALEAEAA